MAITKMENPIASHVILIFLVLVLLSGLFGVHVSCADVPAVFIFGDSTVDVGTNNHLNTTALADFPYYGIDFINSMPTGRFSNGLNSADQIAIRLGFKGSPPPYLSLVLEPSTFSLSILQGVNFASGGSGILDRTGNQSFGEVVSLGEQIQQFALVKGNISNTIGSKACDAFLSQSLFFISVGSNDLFDYDTYYRNTSSIDDFMATLNSTYSNHLMNLYNMGARKFGIVSVPYIGCCPYARLQNKTQNGWGCLDELNDYAYSFYGVISNLLQGLSSQLSDLKYSLGDAYSMTSAVISNPGLLGVTNADTACCGSGQLNAVSICSEMSNSDVCQNRSDYLFWDMYHPTEKASDAAAGMFYGGDLFVVPMNISQLAQIDN